MCSVYGKKREKRKKDEKRKERKEKNALPTKKEYREHTHIHICLPTFLQKSGGKQSETEKQNFYLYFSNHYRIIKNWILLFILNFSNFESSDRGNFKR